MIVVLIKNTGEILWLKEDENKNLVKEINFKFFISIFNNLNYTFRKYSGIGIYKKI